MKPDGVATAALEPMETLESNPVNEGGAPMEQEPNQGDMPQQPAGDASQAEPQPKAKETPASKTSNKTSGDSKAKATSKTPAKTKPSTTSSPKTPSGPRSNTSQSRLANGKPQTNGVAKKTTPAAERKSTPTTAPTKKPVGTVGAPASRSTTKVGEKKPAGASPATNGARTTPGAPAAKKTPSTTANGVKSGTSAAAAAKKPPASKPPSTTSTKPSSVSSPKPDKPPVSKTTRPSSSAARPATGSSQSAGLNKSSTATSKPATSKTASTASKPATPKSTSTAPSGGKPPVSQTSRTSTPVKKDASKPGTPAAKKLADSPLARPSSTTKSAAKPETPKSAPRSDVATKKPAANKAADTKTPSRPKTQDSRPTPSKTPNTKTAAAKASSPKKTVGSSTPTPVKRGPKAASVAEPAKDVAAAVAAAAAAIATAAAAAVIAGPEESQPPPEVATETPAADKTPEPTPEPVPVQEPALKPVQEPTSEPLREPTPEPVREPTPEPVRAATPEPVREPTPEPVREPTPEPVRAATPEPVREPTPEPVRAATPEPVREPTPEPVREPTPEPVREPTPEPVREPTPEPVREPTPEPVREPTPEPVLKMTPEPVREPTPEPEREPSPEFLADVSHPAASVEVGAVLQQEAASGELISSPMDSFKFPESDQLVPSLGTTVMSPPCSPPGPASPLREPQHTSSLLDTAWEQSPAPKLSPLQSSVHTEEEKENDGFAPQEMHEEEEEQEEEDKENLLMPAPAQPQSLGACPPGGFAFGELLVSPHEKEEAVEKADQEINEDIDEDDDDDDEEQRRLGQQLSSMVTDMSTSQPSDDFQARYSALGGSAGWHGDDLLSGMDSEDVSSCTSSRQPGVSDLSSTLHTAILEGTQSSDALVDCSLRGSEGDGNLMGSPNVETFANEEEEEEEDEDERVDDMDMSSEKVEEHQRGFQEEEDEDVEMHSEGVMESFGNEDDDLNKECLDNFAHSAAAAPSWAQTNPFADSWAQPASLLSASSPSPLSDHGAAESETPSQSPALAYLDNSGPSFAALEPHKRPASHEDVKDSAPEEADEPPGVPAAAMSQSGPLSGAAPAAHSSSETSTPEELQDYDSSSGVESRSDKQHTPVPAAVQPDVEQDLGIHLEKGDGEEEEAETLPADEVLGTGPPTAPASAPSSSSTSGDEASDTEGEMQINDPEAPAGTDERVGLESPPPSCTLPALEEDEEAGGAGDGEEDGGGATPQSANSVASYGFDCTTSNSNAHSMAESCGKSPDIFSLENEEQLPEEAKDPSLIKELTLPSAGAAQAEDLLGSPVNLMPLGHADGGYARLDDHHYLFGGKMAADHLEEVDPLEPSQHLGGPQPGETGDSQPAYYSTICDKTDSFLEGDEKCPDEDQELQTRSREDNWNQNHAAFPVANGHYLALVPGNRRPIDPALAEHFAQIAPPLPLSAAAELQQRQEQERQKRQWLEEERLRLEQQKQLEKQRRELLQLQLQQQQQEHRHRRQVLQWQLELEHQYRMQQKQIQQQQQLRRSPTGVMLSPSSGLCTIYEAMETSEEEEEEEEGGGEQNGNLPERRRQLRPTPPRDLEWNKRVDMVQQLINQTLILSADGGCPPLLLLPVGTGGTLSPLESSVWPCLLPQFSPPAATVTAVSSYSPESRGSSPTGDWTVVEVETQH